MNKNKAFKSHLKEEKNKNEVYKNMATTTIRREHIQ